MYKSEIHEASNIIYKLFSKKKAPTDCHHDARYWGGLVADIIHNRKNYYLPNLARRALRLALLTPPEDCVAIKLCCLTFF